MDIRPGDTVHVKYKEGILHNVQVLKNHEGKIVGNVKMTDEAGAVHWPDFGFSIDAVEVHIKGLCHESTSKD